MKPNHLSVFSLKKKCFGSVTVKTHVNIINSLKHICVMKAYNNGLCSENFWTKYYLTDTLKQLLILSACDVTCSCTHTQF